MTFLPLSQLLTTGRADDHPVGLRNGKIITFARFRADVRALVNRLQTEGCQRAGLWCEDGYAFAVGLFGLAHAGCGIVVPPNAQPGLLAGLRSSWERLITDDLDLPDAVPIFQDFPNDARLEPVIAKSCAITFFTSGSTALPKPVVRTLNQLERETSVLEELYGGLASGPFHATVSHQHIYGLTFKLLWSLAAGRPFATRWHEVWELLLAELEEDSVLISSPAHLSRVGGLTTRRRPGTIFSAGAPLSFNAAQEVARMFEVLPTEIYGSTETGAIANRLQTAPDTPWTPLPSVQLSHHEDGRLRLQSPWVEGCYEGEDLIEPLGDGRFHLRGRADRVAKIEGKRVGLSAVETALLNLPHISEVALTVLRGDRDQLAAAVVLTSTGTAMLAQMGPFRFGCHLRHLLSENLEPLARPRRWRFVDVLPITDMGKRPTSIITALFEDKAHV